MIRSAQKAEMTCLRSHDAHLKEGEPMHDDMHESGGHYAKSNKSNREKQTLPGVVFMWNLKQTNKQKLI